MIVWFVTAVEPAGYLVESGFDWILPLAVVRQFALDWIFWSWFWEVSDLFGQRGGRNRRLILADFG